MAFSKTVVEDKIEVLELGQLQVRTKTTVLEDSVALSSSFHRHVVRPCWYNGSAWVDTDTSAMSARVRGHPRPAQSGSSTPRAHLASAESR